MANYRVEVIITVIYLFIYLFIYSFIYLDAVATADVLDHSEQ